MLSCFLACMLLCALFLSSKMTVGCCQAGTLLCTCVCWASHNVDHGRQQELLANRNDRITSLLCATLQMQESLVFTFRCCQACALLCTCAWRRFLKFAHGRWLELLAGRDFWHQGCVHLHGWQELSVFVSLVHLCLWEAVHLNLDQAECFLHFEQSSCHLPPNADRRSCACTSISGLVPTIPKLLLNVSSGLVLTLQFRIVVSGPEVADECQFGPCAYTSVTRCLMSLSRAIKQIALNRVGTPNLWGQVLGHVLAQARRCMSVLVGAMQRRLDHVLARACYRLVAVQRRRCIVCDS